MTKILLLSHGSLAEGLYSSAEMLMGSFEDVSVISLQKEMGVDELKEEIEEYVEKNKENKIIVFCDIIGGTPFNTISLFSHENKSITVFYGMNLPLLLEAISLKDTTGYEEMIKFLADIKNESIGKSDI